jgi:hypothetical protein
MHAVLAQTCFWHVHTFRALSLNTMGGAAWNILKTLGHLIRHFSHQLQVDCYENIAIVWTIASGSAALELEHASPRKH